MIRGRKESNRALNPSLTHTWNGGPVPAVIWSLTWLTIVRLNLIVIPTFPFTKRVRKVCPVWKAPWFIQPNTDLLPVSESILNMAETLGTTFSPVLWVNTDCLPSMIDSVVNHCLSLTDWGVLYTHTFADRLCCSSNWSTHTHTCVYVVVLPTTSSLPHIVPFKQQADPHTHTHTCTHTLLCTQGSQSWLNKLTRSSQVSTSNNRGNHPAHVRLFYKLLSIVLVEKIRKTEWHQM